MLLCIVGLAGIQQGCIWHYHVVIYAMSSSLAQNMVFRQYQYRCQLHYDDHTW